MRYSYEFKLKCIEMYKLGAYPETPEGVDTRSFHKYICTWVRMADANGSEVLKPSAHQKNWTADERFKLVSKVIAGDSISSVAISAGIYEGQLSAWVRKYQQFGYNGLKARTLKPPKEPIMKKDKIPAPHELSESEYEELIRLRAEVEYYKTENAVIKKRIALRREKEEARLKARKRKLSKNSENKDTD
ncbi:MAG: transposase [Acutalibacteraceae bacterium]